jgi:hypothetical protein
MAGVKSRTMMLVTGAVAVALLVAATALTREPDVTVTVVAAADTFETGRVSRLQVTVTNHQDVPLRPHFAVQSVGYPLSWAATEGAVTMRPGETRLVDLVPRSSQAMLTPGLPEPSSGQGRSRPFVVRVNDLDSTRSWVSERTDVPLTLPPVAGPEFLAWSDERDPRSGLQAPIGWNPEGRRSGADKVDLRTGTAGGVELEVTRGSTAPDDWTEVGLAQTIWRAGCPTVELQVSAHPEYATTDGIAPALAAGIQIRDAAAPLGSPYAWVVLEGRGSAPYLLPSGTLIWPARGEAGRYRARLADVFTVLGQPDPARLNIKLFLAAHRQAPGTHRLLVDSFRCIPPTLADQLGQGDAAEWPPALASNPDMPRIATNRSQDASTLATVPSRAADSTAPADARSAEAPPAAVPSATVPAASTRAIVDQRFDRVQTGWPNDPGATAWFDKSGFRLFARDPSRFVAIRAPTAGPFRDVVATATFRKVGGPSGGGYGLIVRDQGPDARDGLNQAGRYYVLEVDDRGQVGIWRREEDHWVDLLPWTPSEAVRPGTEVNHLTVQAVGQRLTLLVNGAHVASVEDAALTDGAVGVFVGGDLNEVVLERLFVAQIS